jgi:hypothetical protein
MINLLFPIKQDSSGDTCQASGELYAKLHVEYVTPQAKNA